MAKALRIRHWAFLTVLLYGAACVVLAWPLLAAAFTWGNGGPDIWESLAVYKEMPFWIAVDLLMVLQSVFLLLPIDVARERPVARRRWVVVAVVAALLMGLLMGSLVCAVGEVATAKPYILEGGMLVWLAAVSFTAIAWFAWAVIFLRQAASRDPSSAFERVVRHLFAGSVAELLVAVPCHVYTRSKDYCCAGVSTALGLATGLAVLLFAFGPGVFFLFVARARRLRGNAQRSAAAEEEEETKGRIPHTRDAAVWLGVALGFLALAAASGFLPSGYDAEVLKVVCAVAFLVLAGKATIATWRATQDDEPPSFSMAILLLAVLAAVLLALCLKW